MVLTKKAREKLRSEKTKARICLDIDVSTTTFNRWIYQNYKSLTLLSTIQAITKHTGLKETEIFEKGEVKK